MHFTIFYAFSPFLQFWGSFIIDNNRFWAMFLANNLVFIGFLPVCFFGWELFVIFFPCLLTSGISIMIKFFFQFVFDKFYENNLINNILFSLCVVLARTGYLKLQSLQLWQKLHFQNKVILIHIHLIFEYINVALLHNNVVKNGIGLNLFVNLLVNSLSYYDDIVFFWSKNLTNYLNKLWKREEIEDLTLGDDLYNEYEDILSYLLFYLEIYSRSIYSVIVFTKFLNFNQLSDLTDCMGRAINSRFPIPIECYYLSLILFTDSVIKFIIHALFGRKIKLPKIEWFYFSTVAYICCVDVFQIIQYSIIAASLRINN